MVSPFRSSILPRPSQDGIPDRFQTASYNPRPPPRMAGWTVDVVLSLLWFDYEVLSRYAYSSLCDVQPCCRSIARPSRCCCRLHRLRPFTPLCIDCAAFFGPDVRYCQTCGIARRAVLPDVSPLIGNITTSNSAARISSHFVNRSNCTGGVHWEIVSIYATRLDSR